MLKVKRNGLIGGGKAGAIGGKEPVNPCTCGKRNYCGVSYPNRK